MNATDIINKLGIQNLSAEQQDQILELVNLRIGEEVAEQLTEQQQNEYQAMIDGDQAVIDAWLEQNAPNYKDSPVYQEIAADTDNPENIDPAKVFASLAWTQANATNTNEIIERVLAEVKAQLGNGTA